MPAFLTTILSILGLLEGDLPQIESAISGFWTFLSTEFAKLFGQAQAAVAMTGMVAQAQGEVAIHDADKGAQATAFIKSQYQTVDALLAGFPGLAQSLAVRKALVDDGATHAIAAKVVEAAHANVRVAAASPAKP